MRSHGGYQHLHGDLSNDISEQRGFLTAKTDPPDHWGYGGRYTLWYSSSGLHHSRAGHDQRIRNVICVGHIHRGLVCHQQLTTLVLRSPNGVSFLSGPLTGVFTADQSNGRPRPSRGDSPGTPGYVARI